MADADKLAALATLAAGVAHEINNPLAALIASLDAIQGELDRFEAQAAPGPAESRALVRGLREIVGEAQEGASRVSAIVGDLGRVSRHAHVEDGSVEIARALDGATDVVLGELRNRARLVKDYRARSQVPGNPAQLGQVFVNLLLNAAQAIPAGNPASHEIRLTTDIDDTGRVVVEVADSGCGIAPELLPRLFDPFFTTRPPGSGTGLGLSICHAIVHSLGGSIEVESEVGRGSRFRVLLRPV